jgi:Ca-activated chloride channel family protein
MSFADPYLLAFGLLVVVLLAWAAAVAGRRRSARLAAAGVAPAGGRLRASGLWLTLAGLAVLAVAAGGPAVTEPVSHAKGTVILAMDVSESMAATDVPPTRLAAAKRAAAAFINAQPDTVEIGVVAFEQGGLEAAVPSSDHTAALAAVGRLTTGGGTSLGQAVLAALTAITHRAIAVGAGGAIPDIGYWPSATIVLFSDGQNGNGNASGSGAGPAAAAGGGDASGAGTDPTAAAAVAAKAGVHVDTVGVGTAAGTSLDVDGYHLFTALDATSLKVISQATSGSYHPASDAGQLNGIASSINLRLIVTNQPVPLAGALIAVALALLAAGALLTVARTGRVI